MCYALYIGSERELPVELAGDSDNDRMWLGALERGDDRSVVGKFSKPNVYYAASWQDCGCGWLRDTMLLQRPKERERSRTLTRTCVHQLRELIESLLVDGSSVELYFTWEGEQSQPVKRRISMRPDEIGDDQLAMEIGDFAVVAFAPPS